MEISTTNTTVRRNEGESCSNVCIRESTSPQHPSQRFPCGLAHLKTQISRLHQRLHHYI
jgi:hypothetical protein